MKRGVFITIYGINNIGKSTQARLLFEKLKTKGEKVHYLKYPCYDVHPSGTYLNETLRNPEGQKIPEDELQLWFVLNRYQFEPKLKQMLEEGYIVIAEDYIGTGIAWGVAKGLDQEWMESVNKHLLKEDFAIMLTGRRKKDSSEPDHVHEQNHELVEKCRLVHENLADKYGWKRVQVQEKIEDTSELLWKVILDFF